MYRSFARSFAAILAKSLNILIRGWRKGEGFLDKLDMLLIVEPTRREVVAGLLCFSETSSSFRNFWHSFAMLDPSFLVPDFALPADFFNLPPLPEPGFVAEGGGEEGEDVLDASLAFNSLIPSVPKIASRFTGSSSWSTSQLRGGLVELLEVRS